MTTQLQLINIIIIIIIVIIIIIWRVRSIACWVPKASNIHSVCAILIAFTLQKRLHELAWILGYTYTGCLDILCWILVQTAHIELRTNMNIAQHCTTSLEALDWTFAVVRSTTNRSVVPLNSGRDVTWKNTYFDKRNISAVGALSVFLWLRHDTGGGGHDSVTRLSYDLRADIQSRHISTHDLYDSFILFFYQNEVANKLDKIHNERAQRYESRRFLSN